MKVYFVVELVDFVVKCRVDVQHHSLLVSLHLEWQAARSNVGGREHCVSFAIPALCRLQNLARANSDAAECPFLVQSAPLVDNVDRDAPFSVQSNGTEFFRRKSTSSKTLLVEKTYGEIKFSAKKFSTIKIFDDNYFRRKISVPYIQIVRYNNQE